MFHAITSWFHRLQTQWNGFRDGRRQLPHADGESLRHFERAIIESLNQKMTRRFGQGAEEEHRLVGEQEQAAQKFLDHRRRQIELQRRRDAKLKALGLPRDWRSPYSRRHRIAALAVLGIADGALNVIAFEFFRVGGALTLVIAAGIAFGIPFLAHQAGCHVRFAEGTENSAEWRRHWLHVLARILFGVLIIVSVTVLRDLYFHPRGNEDRFFWICFALTFGVFGVAASVSYSMCHRDEAVEHAGPYFDKLDSEMAAASKAQVKPRRRIVALVQDRQTNLVQTSAALAALEQAGLSLIYVYRRANERARPEGNPIRFVTDPAFVTESLKWWQVDDIKATLDGLMARAEREFLAAANPGADQEGTGHKQEIEKAKGAWA